MSDPTPKKPKIYKWYKNAPSEQEKLSYKKALIQYILTNELQNQKPKGNI